MDRRKRAALSRAHFARWTLAAALLCGALGASASEESDTEPGATGDAPVAPPHLLHDDPLAPWGDLEILGARVPRGESRRLSFLAEASFLKESLDVPVLVSRGARRGPTLCLSAAVHGDELNGVEITRQVHAETSAGSMAGTLLALPIVNVHGFRKGTRYLADRRDLNRSFPGNPNGSMASRLAHAVFSQVVVRCDALIDLHTGSLRRSNLPQIRVDLGDMRATVLALAFGAAVVVDDAGPPGSLRRAAMDAGVPAIIYEAGEPERFEHDEILRGVYGVRNVMQQLRMIPGEPEPTPPQRVFRRTVWVRSAAGGIFLTDTGLGRRVEPGDLLGTVTDPLTNQRSEVRASHAGEVIGMAYPQVVLPGFALFHLGLHP